MPFTCIDDRGVRNFSKSFMRPDNRGLIGRRACAGDTPGQNTVNVIKDKAFFSASGEKVSLLTVLAGAFDKVANVKIKGVSVGDHDRIKAAHRCEGG